MNSIPIPFLDLKRELIPIRKEIENKMNEFKFAQMINFPTWSRMVNGANLHNRSNINQQPVQPKADFW